MHRLVPQFILRKQRIGQMQGEMEAVALFIDILGFTALTESLMANGSEGAEVLADTLQVIFTPVFETSYSQHGFISSFAGDALIALFPIANEHVNTRALASSSQKNLSPEAKSKRIPTLAFRGKRRSIMR